ESLYGPNPFVIGKSASREKQGQVAGIGPALAQSNRSGGSAEFRALSLHSQNGSCQPCSPQGPKEPVRPVVPSLSFLYAPFDSQFPFAGYCSEQRARVDT